MLEFLYTSSYQASQVAIYSIIHSLSIPMVAIDNDECIHPHSRSH